MANVLLRGISACEMVDASEKPRCGSSLYEKIAVLIVACAAMVSAALGDTQWYAGDGCLTDLEKWTEKPHVRLRHRRHGDRLLLESVGCDGAVRRAEGGHNVADSLSSAKPMDMKIWI